MTTQPTYRASRSSVRGVVTPEAVVLEFDTAGVGTRAAARVIDAVIVAIGATTLFGSLVSWLGAGQVTGVILVGFLAVFGYPCACETVWGATPGKTMLGLRVITDEGGPARFRHCAIRSAMQLVDLVLLPVGVIAVVSVVAGDRDQRLGDRLAGTIVVRTASLAIRPRAVGFPPLPGYEGYTSSLDVGAITPERYEVIRSFLTRVDRLSPPARQHLAHRLARPVAALIGHATPPGMHPELFLASVAAAYQQRHGGPATWMWGPWAPTAVGPPLLPGPVAGLTGA